MGFGGPARGHQPGAPFNATQRQPAVVPAGRYGGGAELPKDEPTVGDQRLPSERRRAVGSQEGHRGRRVIGSQLALQGLPVNDSVEPGIGVDRARAHRIGKTGSHRSHGDPSGPSARARDRMIPTTAPLLAL